MTGRALERVAWFALFLIAVGCSSVIATRPHTSPASQPVAPARDPTMLTDAQIGAYILKRVNDDAAKSGEKMLFPAQVNTIVHVGPDKVVVDLTVGRESWGSGRKVDFLMARGWHITGWCERGVPCESAGG